MRSLEHIDFEIRKDAAGVFRALLQLADMLGASEALAGHLRLQPTLLAKLLRLDSPDLSSCSTLQTCARNPKLAEALLELGALPALLQAVTEGGSAELILEAFAILRELLCGPAAEVCVAHLADSATEFFGSYRKLLQSEDYFVQRQGLSLLAQFLVHPAYTQVMLDYVGNERHLQLIMNLLRSPSTSIALEAFHVLKLFVASPHQPSRVRTILHRNCDRLVRLLQSLASLQPQNEDLQADMAMVAQGLLAPIS
jgi:calcium binding protein 39